VPDSFDNRVRTLLRNELPSIMGRQNASAYAQQGNGGASIANIRRGVGKAELIGLGSNITVSATSYAALSTPLTLSVWLSGRPVRVSLTAIVGNGASGSIDLDVKLRGTSITTGGHLISTNQTHIGTVHAEETVMEPAAGLALFEVVALRATANATIYVQSTNRIVLTVTEL
jgi:hypothetical protein